MPATRITVEPILPKKKNYPQARFNLFYGRLERYIKRDVKRLLIRDFDATVQGWEHKPNFVGEYKEPYGTQLQLHVHPQGQHTKQWQRVSDGTGPRDIVSGRGVMHFQHGGPGSYRPKTTPGGRYGGPGTKSGPWRHTRIVRGHRIEPRKFSEKIKEKREKEIQRDIEKIRIRTFGNG